MIIMCRKWRKIITAVKAFLGKPYDGNTIDPLLEQIEDNKLKLLQELIYDRGGKGWKQIRDVTIITADKPKASQSASQKQQKRNKCRAGAAIEPILGHLELKRTSVWDSITCGAKKAYKSMLTWQQQLEI